MMKKMWKNDLPLKACKLMNNERVVREGELKLPNKFKGEIDACFACPSNREQNVIPDKDTERRSSNFGIHILENIFLISQS
jgi:hypothetical protein